MFLPRSQVKEPTRASKRGVVYATAARYINPKRLSVSARAPSSDQILVHYIGPKMP